MFEDFYKKCRMADEIKTSDKAKKTAKAFVIYRIKEGHMQDDSKSKSRFVKWIAVTTVLMLLLIPGSIYADDIKILLTEGEPTPHDDVFTGELVRNETIAEFVKKDVYENTDGHLKVTIKELLSDQKSIQAVVFYEALDYKGRAWIKNFDEKHYYQGASYYMYMGMEIPNGFGKLDKQIRFDVYPRDSMNYGWYEIKKYRTASTLCLMFWYCSIDVYYEYEAAAINCPMTDDVYQYAVVDIDMPADMNVKEYKLVGETNINKYYDAMYVRLTDLSCVIYGTQKGLYETGENENGLLPGSWLISEEELIDAAPQVTLNLKDGTSMNFDYEFVLWPIRDDQDGEKRNPHGADIMLWSINYFEKIGIYGTDAVTPTISPEEVESITINGHVLKLEEFA